MLVKELRQGLRAKTFIAVFLSLQVFLGIMLLSATASSTSDRAGSVVSGMIFTFFSIAVLIVQPLRGVSALSSEIKGNTINMMVLTRLSAWRIVFGKWVAIVSQSALILSTIIPYLILRYFFGGMNLVGEVVFLGLLFLTSMALTCVTVGLSGCSSVFMRGILPLFGTPVLFMSMVSLLFNNGPKSLIDACSLDTSESRLSIAIYIAAITYLGGSALSLGASLIAPAAENHSSLRRLIAILAALAMIPVMRYSTLDKEILLTFLGLIAAPAILIAVTESTPLVSTVCKPFVKHGALGKAAGIFLYPGLACGIFFTVLLIAICIIACSANPMMGGYADQFATIVLALLGTLLFPAVLQVFFFKGEGQRVANYLLLLIAIGILTGILGALTAAMSNYEFLWLFIWDPLIFTVMTGTRHFNETALLHAAITVDLILITILLIAAIGMFKAGREAILQAGEELEGTLPSP